MSILVTADGKMWIGHIIKHYLTIYTTNWIMETFIHQ